MNETLALAADCVREIYQLVDRLERLFPGRHFTPDGHMVGSIGEVVAAARFGLELLPAGNGLHDAKSVDGRAVQIKATQGQRIAFRGDVPPDHLIVLFLSDDGSTTTIYNGPGLAAWEGAGAPQSNGQRQVGLTKLRRLMGNVAVSDQLPVICEHERTDIAPSETCR